MYRRGIESRNSPESGSVQVLIDTLFHEREAGRDETRLMFEEPELFRTLIQAIHTGKVEIAPVKSKYFEPATITRAFCETIAVEGGDGFMTKGKEGESPLFVMWLGKSVITQQLQWQQSPSIHTSLEGPLSVNTYSSVEDAKWIYETKRDNGPEPRES